MTIKDEILAIANQLADSGITPTVATVKGKLSSSAPLPTIINTLKNWQHKPGQTQVPSHTDTNVEQNSQSDTELTAALQPLLNELIEIKTLLASIDKKLD